MKHFIGTVLKNTQVSQHFFELQFSFPNNSNEIPRAGQFISLALENSAFRKPFAVSNYDVKTNICSILYEIRGAGTRFMSSLTCDNSIDIMGFHGNSFIQPKHHAVLVAGGIGLGPMLYFAHTLIAEHLNFSLYTGFRTETIIPHSLFTLLHTNQKSSPIHICTDDGSYGIQGSCIDALTKSLHKNNSDTHYYFCGPHAMLKAGVAAVDNHNHTLQSYVSVETLMACCTGACMGCVVDTHNHQKPYLRACLDGPVFDSKEIRL